MSSNDLVLILAVVEAVQLVLLALIYAVTRLVPPVEDKDSNG